MFLSSEHVAVYIFHEGAGKRIHAQRHTRGKHQTADNPVMQTKSRNNQKKLSLKKKLLPISLLLKAQLTETIHHKIGLNKKKSCPPDFRECEIFLGSCNIDTQFIQNNLFFEPFWQTAMAVNS